ncbi:MAG: hypothetical protein J6I49_06510, partial [Bacteroidales bacterium]|nr:hypothetical protein [Bacteroidales bacterium]
MRKRLFFVLALAALLPLGMRAQELGDYAVSVTQETYTSIASASQLLSSVNGDGGSQTVALPFNFVFGAQTYTQGTTLTVRPDGYIFFGTTSPGHNAKTAYESTSANYYAIAPFFVGDGKITASGATSGAYKLDTVDADGNAMLVIEWKDLQGYHAPNGSYNYQLRLHADGSISAIIGTCTASTYSVVKHNFLLVAGTQDRISLSGTWSSNTVTSETPLPDLGASLPASGTVITFAPPASFCPRPIASVSESALDGATISWHPVDGASGYLVTFGSNEYFTSDTSYSFTDLASSHVYTGNLRTLCSTGDTSNPISFTFNTLCGELTSASLPYVQDFESAPSTGEAMPYCWTRGTTSTSSPKVNDAASNAHSPSKFLYVFTAGGIAALPPIDTTDLDITDLMLSFYARSSSTNPLLLDVGIMTDPLDNSTFQLVQQVSVLSQTHELFEVPFTLFTGHGAYVAFRSVQSNNIYVDDVVLDYIPDCMRPELTISEVSPSGATLHLSDANDVNHYMVYVTAGSTTDSIELYDTVYTLTDISPVTNVSVSALTLCSDGSRTNVTFGSFRTLCSALEATDLPFIEDFQSTGTTNAQLSSVHDCWNVINFGSSSFTNYPQAYSTAGPDNSTRVVYFYGYAGQTEIIVSPQINTDLNDLAVYFWVRYVTSGVGLTLGTMSDPTDASTFHPVQTATPPSSGWHYHEYTLASALAGDHYVAFRMDGLTGSSSGGVMIDNITILTAPSCMRPNSLAVSDITNSEVTLTVDDATHVDNYYVALLHGSDTVATTIISDTTLTIDTLTANTAYTFVVWSLCSDGTRTTERTTSFRTACATITTLPWTEDFESYTGGSSATATTSVANIPCWSFSDLNGNTTYVTTSQHHGGNQGLRYYGSSTYPSYLILPPFDEDISNLTLTFWMNSANLNAYVGVGYMTNPTDASTYTEVGQIYASATNTWEFHDIILGPGADGRIAMRYYGSSQNIYLDDITVMLTPACVRPSAVTVANVDTTNATIRIADINETNHYIIVFSDGTVTDSVEVYDSVYTFTDLTPATSYNLSVSTICDDGSRTLAVSASFRTECVYISILPWHEDFETGYDGLYGSYATRMPGTYPPCYGFIEHNSSAFMHFTSSNYLYGGSGHSLAFYPGTANASNILILPPFTENISGLEMTFWHRSENAHASAGQFDVGYITDPTDRTTFVPVETWNYNDMTNYIEAEVTFAAAPDGARIAFRHRTVAYNYYWFIDEIDVHTAPSCTRPSISVSDIDSASATLHLADANDVNHYMVYITNGTAIDSIEVSDTLHIFTDLTPATGYSVSAVTLCSDGTRTTVTSTTFRTSCAMITTLPWTEGFESFEAGTSATAAVSVANIPCWDFSDLNGNYSYISTSQHHEGSKAVRYYGSATYPSYMVLPPFQDDLSDLMFTFWMRSSNANAYVGVGYMTNPADPTTYTEVAQARASATNTWEFKDIVLGANATGRIALRYYGASQEIYLDEFTVMLAPSCLRPTSVSVSNITQSTADLTINDANNTDHYMVYYSTSSVTDSIEVYDSVYTLTGLSASTQYTVSVVTLCSDGTRTPATTTPFLTECGAITTLPWTEDFTTWTNESDGTQGAPCWTLHYSQNGHYPYIVALAGQTPNSLVYRESNGVCPIVVLPAFGYALSELSLEFYCTNMSGSSALITGYITNPIDRTTFVPVDTIWLTSGWSPHTVTFPTTASGRIAIYMHSNSGNGGRLDDITVSLADTTATPPDPTYYTVSAESEDATMGSATVSPSGTVNVGTSVTFTATPATGYTFVAWMDGTTQVSTANPYTTTVTGNLALTATFQASSNPQPTTYTVSAATADATMGAATVTPSGTVNAGTSVTFTATANTGYHFVAWMSGTTQVSTANP